MTKSIAVDRQVDVAGQPTQVGAGVNGWRIFVYNQQNPVAKAFTGVSYYPYDPAFRVTAQFTPDAGLPPRVFRTSRGTDKLFYHAGDAVFMLKGKSVTLPFYAESNDPKLVKDMSAFYTDNLTGKGAYGAGRYVDVADFHKFPPAKVIIDFNQAYNPNCARSAHGFTRPLATDTCHSPGDDGGRARTRIWRISKSRFLPGFLGGNQAATLRPSRLIRSRNTLETFPAGQHRIRETVSRQGVES